MFISAAKLVLMFGWDFAGGPVVKPGTTTGEPTHHSERALVLKLGPDTAK